MYIYNYIYILIYIYLELQTGTYFCLCSLFCGTSVFWENERKSGKRAFLGNAHILNIAMGQNSHLALLGCPLCPMARSPRALPIPNPTTLSQVCVFAHRRYSCDGFKLKNMRRQPRGGSAKMACLKQKTIGACLLSLLVQNDAF